VVALTNEHAGSDGDIFSHNFKLMASGRWSARARGAASSASGRGTRSSTARETTQPEFSFWFSDVGFGVENYGTDPTIEVDNAPQDAREGRDRQLETALADRARSRLEGLRPAFRNSARPGADETAATGARKR
jgi:tricorn protease